MDYIWILEFVDYVKYLDFERVRKVFEVFWVGMNWLDVYFGKSILIVIQKIDFERGKRYEWLWERWEFIVKMI